MAGSQKTGQDDTMGNVFSVTLNLKICQIVISLIALILSIISAASGRVVTAGIIVFIIFTLISFSFGLLIILVLASCSCRSEGPDPLPWLILDLIIACILSAGFFPLSLLLMFEGPVAVAAGIFGFIDMAVCCLYAMILAANLAESFRG